MNLTSRTDALQPQHPTERFRYDALERLTCAYFSANENPLAPCALSYGYAPNGNLTFKSDVGALSYNDPKHPHAVTAAGGESYGYDAIGNQKTRPGGVTVSYTPFDLPEVVKQGAALCDPLASQRPAGLSHLRVTAGGAASNLLAWSLSLRKKPTQRSLLSRCKRLRSTSSRPSATSRWSSAPTSR